MIARVSYRRVGSTRLQARSLLINHLILIIAAGFCCQVQPTRWMRSKARWHQREEAEGT